MAIADMAQTFFSTDVVKYQNSTDPNGTTSMVALQRWLEVTLPLTFATLAIGYACFKWADQWRKKEYPTLSGAEERV
jgi:hypothetical protein